MSRCCTIGLEKHFDIKFDRESMVQLKQMKFKGIAQPTVIRRKKSNNEITQGASLSDGDGCPLQFPYPYETGLTSEELAERKAKQVEKQRDEVNSGSGDNSRNDLIKLSDGGGISTPQYSLVNQFDVDLSDFTESSSSTLPEIRSASACELDITEQHIHLSTLQPVSYLLELDLPYPVDEDRGTARFDKTKRQLIVRLIVNRQKAGHFLQETDSLSTSEIDATQLESTSVPDALTDVTQSESTSVPATSADAAQSERTSVSAISADAAQLESASVLPVPTDTIQYDHAANQPCGDNSNLKSTNQINGQVAARLIEEESDFAHRKLSFEANVLYKLPPFSYEHDDECVTLIVEVQHVLMDSLSVYKYENMVEVMFYTISGTGFKVHYYLNTTFPGPVKEVQQSIGAKNIVLNVYREHSDALWTKFTSQGADSQSMESHEFLTQNQILSELENLELLANQGSKIVDRYSKHEPENMVVTEVNSSHLCIDIMGAKGKPWEPNAPEVVHMQATSDYIHGILKHAHSDVEQPDEVSNTPDLSRDTTDQTSPLEQPHIFRERKKSVSFSEKIEETKFKSKDTVSHMHKTLVNRRKKKRQRENHYQRRHSSNSECSSGDEVGRHNRSRHSSSASEDYSTSNMSTGSSPQSECSDIAFASTEDACTIEADDIKSNDTGSQSSEVAYTGHTDKNDNNIDGNGDEYDGDEDDSLLVRNQGSVAADIDNGKLFEFDNSVIFDLDD